MDATKRKEWVDLKESERNCLMWPDFLEWGKPENVEVHLDNHQTSLGLVSVAVQDPVTNKWYHISKRMKENQPAHQGCVKLYKWITKVNGKETNLQSEEFSKLFKNRSGGVCLSMKTAVDPLSKFVKKWQNEKTITENGKTLKERVTFVHFYSKEDEEIKDHIIVWEVKRKTDQEISLNRGDEILAVNDKSVQGKKLAEIYKLISDQIPAEVKLKIREVEHANSCTKAGVEPTNTILEIEQPLTTSDTNVPPETNGPENCNPTDRLEMDENAGQEMRSEVYENPISNIEESQTAVAVPETAVKSEDSPADKKPLQEEGKKKGKKLSLRRRSSSSITPSSDRGKTLENEGYKDTPPPERKFSPTSYKMCQQCEGTTELPDDRNKWPILKMEISHYRKVCQLLDLRDRSKEPLLSALGCFTVEDSDTITQEFTSFGGLGTAKKALGRWEACDGNNNVGALKKILKDKMKREDVLNVIEEWEKLAVCHGCGVRLKP